MRDTKQQMQLSQLLWELFHQLVLLNLQIIAIFSAKKIDIDSFVVRYVQRLGEKSAKLQLERTWLRQGGTRREKLSLDRVKVAVGAKTPSC